MMSYCRGFSSLRGIIQFSWPAFQNYIPVHRGYRSYRPLFLTGECNSKPRNLPSKGSHVRYFCDIKPTDATSQEESSTPKFAGTREKHSYSYLKSNPEYHNTFFDSAQFTSTTILSFHKKIRDFIEVSYGENLPFITDSSMDNIVSELLDDLTNFTVEELCAILFSMSKFPIILKVNTPKFESIWTKIDMECFRRIPQLDNDSILQVADLFFRLRLGKLSSFHWNVVKRFLRHSDNVSKIHFIRLSFCLSLTNTLPDSINRYPLEFNWKRLIEEMSAEEIAVVAEGIFHISYTIKDKDFIAKMLEIVASERQSISSAGLINLSKLVHFSSHFSIGQNIYLFHEAMLPEIERLSPRAAVYLGLIGTNSRSLHEKLFQAVVSKVENILSELDIQDISNLCEMITLCDFKCDNLCLKLIEDLRDRVHRPGFLQRSRQFARIVHCLNIKGFIMEDLISISLSTEFLGFWYDSNMYRFKPEVMFNDLTATIELENYQGPKLTEKQRGYLLKKNMYWLNWLDLPPKRVISEYKRFVRSFIQTAEEFLGGPKFFRATNILPHFKFADGVFCTDITGNIVEIPDCYLKNEEYLMKTIPDKTEIPSINFHAIMLVSRSGCMYNSHNLTGLMLMQRRQMQKLGYIIHQAYAHDWMGIIEDESLKRQYLIDSLTNHGQQNINAVST